MDEVICAFAFDAALGRVLRGIVEWALLMPA